MGCSIHISWCFVYRAVSQTSIKILKTHWYFNGFQTLLSLRLSYRYTWLWLMKLKQILIPNAILCIWEQHYFYVIIWIYSAWSWILPLFYMCCYRYKMEEAVVVSHRGTNIHKVKAHKGWKSINFHSFLLQREKMKACLYNKETN